MSKKISALAILLMNIIAVTSLLASENIQVTHQKIDISKYIFGRRMIVNKCYAVLQDTNTIFSFDPQILTIQTCSNHQCSYSIDDHNFTLGSCQAITDNKCSDDPAADYIDRFSRTATMILQANILTFVDSKGDATIQLRDIPK